MVEAVGELVKEDVSKSQDADELKGVVGKVRVAGPEVGQENGGGEDEGMDEDFHFRLKGIGGELVMATWFDGQMVLICGTPLNHVTIKP